MKPLETRYKSYRFRSRTEARWAVFFDALGLQWEYEKQGYDLGDGLLYLPDFYIKDFGWVEVKGQPPTAEEIDKAGRLCAFTRCRVIIVQGSPDRAGYNIAGLFEYHRHTASYRGEDTPDKWITGNGFAVSESCGPDDQVKFVECRVCGAILVETTWVYGHWCERNERAGIVGDRLDNAYAASLSARFEHDES